MMKRKKTTVRKKPTASQLARTAIRVFDVDSDKDVDKRDIAKLRKGQKLIARKKAVANKPVKRRVTRKKRKNPIAAMHPIAAFATGASGILTALQIKRELSNPTKRKRRRTGRKPATVNPVRNARSFLVVSVQKRGRQTMRIGLYKTASSDTAISKAQRDLDKILSRARAKDVTLKAIRVPANFEKLSWDEQEKIIAKGIKPVPRVAARPKLKQTKRKNPITKKPACRNPKVPQRRTFEMFQGRKATTAKQMLVSPHAPARLDQLGDLIELKLKGKTAIKFNPKRYKLCACGGKLWIAGGKFAKSNPAEKTNVLNPIAEIEHVVYGTRKPHHGDVKYTHYIHKLGEESGTRPVLAVDRDGFPVIRGGNYKIEARGIVD